MNFIRKIKTFLHAPWTLGQKMMEWTWWLWTDAAYLTLYYFFCMKKTLHLKKPKTFNEKLQWLKLNDRKPIYTTLVDKYAVKDEISRFIGPEYLIPTLGVWNNVEEINWKELPNRFVLKTTHGGGGSGVVVCKDKESLDIENAKSVLRKAMNTNIYSKLREWPYKNVIKRIIAEEYMEDSHGELLDYKFFCFDGYVHSVMVCMERSSGETKYYFFNRDWNLLRLNKWGEKAPKGFTLPKPQNIGEMFDLAAKLSQGMPFVRVDMYNVDGKIYFGELTFYSDSGFDRDILSETDEILGKLINLDCSEFSFSR